MIELETRLLEILDWDDEKLEEIYLKASRFLETCKLSDRGSMEKAMVSHLAGVLDEEGVNLLMRILDQNIIRETRIIEE